MTRGRKPKPTALKETQGNPGKRPLNQREPKPRIEVPYCPRHLSDEAKREWKRIAKDLQKMGILTKVDRAALAAYCTAWARWVKAETEVQKHGEVIKTKNGNLIQNPYLAIANRAMTEMVRIGSEFGLTPSSRTRIAVEPDQDEDDLVTQLFSRING